ncbi:MAG: tRNA glutamyl-Q(34) synthetase GluQRS [Cellvibrionales bacterium]|nr:tRNA glutamyl-Q(34) synthetase GluQRS [Cellvibrionales bacterium]
MPYIGRFAPSPTGPLHLGSLVAALGSYLDARAHSGQWQLRIDDLDPPREARGARTQIPAQLRAHGLHWDGPIRHQSQHLNSYQKHLTQLTKAGQTYRCQCPRQRLRTLQGRYDGHCRTRQITNPDSALRLRFDRAPSWQDLLHGRQQPTATELGGDFIIQRRDGLISYQLATAVDDAPPGITHVLRGADLLESTARQIHLQQCLNLPTPTYGHLPLIRTSSGDKLSKQTGAPPLDTAQAAANLIAALKLLGQPTPPKMRHQPCAQILQQATAHWNRASVPRADVPPSQC